MKKYFIKTLGCKVNQYESESISKEFSENDLIPVTGDTKADVCVINTCTVTQKAAMQSRQAIRQAIRANPGARIVVTGCYAETELEQIKKIKGVHEVIGNTAKHRLLDIIKPDSCNDKYTRLPINKMFQFEHMPFVPTGSRTRPFLKIQDGCNSFCTYCIVPHARGPSRSLPLQKVLENIRYLKENGYREVVLTGIHLGCYGTDLSPEIDIFTLLKEVLEKKIIDRIRLSSLEPVELTEAIIQLTSESTGKPGNICHHFHIPLQSGDDTVLKKMGRLYSREFFKNLVLNIHDHLPDAAIGVDTLIGFPGESEQAFENTYNLIHELPVAYLHVFPFSPRKGTPAYSFTEKIATDIIKNRCKRMRELGRIKRQSFYKKFIRKNLEILVESKRDRKTGLLKGLASNYIPVLIPGNDNLKNSFVNVNIDKVDKNNNVYGTMM